MMLSAEDRWVLDLPVAERMRAAATSTSSALLVELSQSTDTQVRWAAFRNPNLPAANQEALVAAWAARRDTVESTLDLLQLLRNPALSSGLLGRIAEIHPDSCVVRGLVVAHPMCPEVWVTWAVTATSATVRVSLARNPALSASAAWALANSFGTVAMPLDLAGRVRRNLLENPAVPDEVKVLLVLMMKQAARP